MGRRGQSAALQTIAVVTGIVGAAAFASAQTADAPTIDDKRQGRVSVQAVTSAPVDADARAALTEPARAAADASGLPLLLPDDAALVASAQVTSGDGWIAASMQADGLHVAVHGLAVAIEWPSLLAEVGGALDAVRVAHSHAIWTVSFEAHGMAWALDVECASGPADARCASPDAARGLAATMVAVSAGGQ